MRRYAIGLLVAAALHLAGCGGGGTNSGTTTTTSDVFSRMSNGTDTSSTAGAISGTVVNSAGQPVASATVTVTGGSSSRAKANAGFTTTTNASGHWSIGNVAAGSYTVTASYEGQADISMTVTVQAGQVHPMGSFGMHPPSGGGTGNADFGGGAVTDAGSIVGKVIDSNGAAISKARVSIAGAWHAMTGDAGGFALGPLPAGKYVVDCVADGYAAAQQTAEVVAGEAVTLTFTLTVGSGTTTVATGTVSGTVTDLATGSALAGVSVTLESGRATATTDASGAYSFTGVTPGAAMLAAALTGYAPFEVPICVPPGSTITVNIKMVAQSSSTATATGGVKLTITDKSTAQPIKGAVVRINRKGPFYTDDNGVLTITGIPVGKYNLRVGARGYETIFDVLTVTADATATLSYALATQTLSLPGNVEAGPGLMPGQHGGND